MNFTIHKATAKETELITPLFDAYRVFYQQQSDIELARSFIGDRLQNGEFSIFYAKDSDCAALGFVQLYPTFSSVSAKRSWVLNDLFVSDAARRTGVAKALMEAARRYAIETGAKGLSLQTAYDNDKAQALYESLGYQKDNHYLTYYLSL